MSWVVGSAIPLKRRVSGRNTLQYFNRPPIIGPMSAEAHPWSPSPAEESALDPEALLGRLGWDTPQGSPTEAPSYSCTFCWSNVPPGAEACPECGHTRAEMDAASARQAETDKSWTPARLLGSRRGAGQPSSGPPPLIRKYTGLQSLQEAQKLAAVSPKVVEPPPAHSIRRGFKLLVITVTVGGFLGVAAVAGWHLAFLTFPKPDFIPTPDAPPVVQPEATVAIKWYNPFPELHLELRNSAGQVLARSTDPSSQHRIAPGTYLLRIMDNRAQWQAPEKKVTAVPGKLLALALPATSAADYYVWLGKRLHELNKPEAAERAWRTALRARPDCVEAHLQLAALLAVQYRYESARLHLKKARAYAPGDERVRRLERTLDRLERGR
jgi:hypothetical protein